MPEDMDAKKVDATAVAETVDVVIFHLPRTVMLILHAHIIKI